MEVSKIQALKIGWKRFPSLSPTDLGESEDFPKEKVFP